jgi:hypothetical protein
MSLQSTRPVSPESSNRGATGLGHRIADLAAIDLCQRLGFHIVGTVPGAFAHPTQGRVGLHIMYRER